VGERRRWPSRPGAGDFSGTVPGRVPLLLSQVVVDIQIGLQIGIQIGLQIGQFGPREGRVGGGLLAAGNLI